MSAPKRPKNEKSCAPKKKFDPQGVLESIREKGYLIKKVQDACEELIKVASQ